MSSPDVIDHLAGLDPSSPLGQIRGLRAQARTNAQRSYEALLAPGQPGTVSELERLAVATFAAGLHGQPETRDFYAERLAGLKPGQAFLDRLADETSRGVSKGPYGSYPAGPLSAEDEAGPAYRASAVAERDLGQRIAAALTHTHLLVFRPRDAKPDALQALLDAGWSTAEIVTLSQLVSFLAFQIRTVAGLRVLATTPIR